MLDEPHDLEFTVLQGSESENCGTWHWDREEHSPDGARVGEEVGEGTNESQGVEILTLNRLSCKTFLIAISSWSFAMLTMRAWKTMPKEPFPMTLQFV
jgi:hypothetical protein